MQYDYRVSLESDDAPAKVLRMVGVNKRVLEVGCACGSQTRVLSGELGCSVTAVEVDALAASVARSYCEDLIVGDVEQLDLRQRLGESRFDVVIFADVLEHLREPGKTLESVSSHLAENGYIVASIPNVTHAAVVMEMARGKFEYRPFGLLDSTHLRFFARESVFSLFEGAGLSIIALDRVRRSPEATELEVECDAPANRALFNEIRRSNPEYDTYQFVVKAVRRLEGSQLPEYEADPSQQRVAALEALLHAKERQIKALTSELEWIINRPSFRLWSRVKRLLKPRE